MLTKRLAAGHQHAMGWPARLAAAAAVVMHTTACGARTGFDEGSDQGRAGPAGASGSPGASQSQEDGVFCAFHVGPVASCDVPPADGPVQQCTPAFGHCIDVGGQWGCCNSASNNNGAGGSCSFPMFGVTCH